MANESKSERKSQPRISILITVVLLALTVQDQLSSGSIDTPLLIADLILAAFWTGQPIDALLSKWLR
ncbi:MAG TPA: hypothetical protein VEW07_11430 [Solirubrobacterales bacterium]|nr:hypothetical protein [Solirubrobacterales bacterium]